MKGKLSVTRAAQRYKVKNVMITSSIAAVSGGCPPKYALILQRMIGQTLNVSTQRRITKPEIQQRNKQGIHCNFSKRGEVYCCRHQSRCSLGPNITTVSSGSNDFIKEMMLGKIPTQHVISFDDVRDVSQTARDSF